MGEGTFAVSTMRTASPGLRSRRGRVHVYGRGDAWSPPQSKGQRRCPPLFPRATARPCVFSARRRMFWPSMTAGLRAIRCLRNHPPGWTGPMASEPAASRSSMVMRHWHTDRVAGNAAFRDCAIIAHALTARALEDARDGDAWRLHRSCGQGARTRPPFRRGEERDMGVFRDARPQNRTWLTMADTGIATLHDDGRRPETPGSACRRLSDRRRRWRCRAEFAVLLRSGLA
jgi:hypothetical protein